MAAVAGIEAPPGVALAKSDEGRERRTYDRAFMLALSKSPLVQAPDSMPTLAQWYGDWEPYHFRQFPQQGNHAGKGHRSGGGALYGGAGAEGGEPGTSRNRYRRGERAAMEQAGAELDGAGRNPFGQISSSGAFRPAGRPDGLATSPGAAAAASYGRNGVMGKIGREISQRGTRGGLAAAAAASLATGDLSLDGGSFDDHDDPESARRRAAGASDWRRAPGGAGQASRSPMASKTAFGREQGGHSKTSFPSWMADEAEPAWISGGGGGGGGGRHKDGEQFNEHNDINVDDVDVSGMDSIQAFKVRMKEKERRARQRELGLEAGAADSSFSSQQGESGADRSQAALFDDFASSAKQRAQSKALERQEDDGGVNGDDQVDVAPRTSRFARFFDGGKPQAQTGAPQISEEKQQQQPPATSHPAAPAETGTNNNNNPVSMADLFRSMGVNRQEPAKANAASPPTRPPPGLSPSTAGDADAQGMQKIMALLSGGGGVNNAADQSHANNPSAPPRPPPGLHFAGTPTNRPDFGSPVTGASPSSPHHLRQNRGDASQSPSMQHHPSHFQPQQQSPPPPPPPPPGWHGGQPLYGPPPPGFGLDARMLGHNPQSPSAENGKGMTHPSQHHPPPPPPMHAAGFPPFPPGMRPPPLPPQLQQHLIGLPPQVQHQIISQHFHQMAASSGAGPPPPPHMHPPPPPPFAAQMQHMQHPHAPHQQSPSHRPMYSAGGSPPPPGGAAGDGNAGHAHLMALLGQANAS